MQLQKSYLPFYFDGRDDELDTEELDLDELAERCLRGPSSIYDVLLSAVTTLAAPLAHGSDKREWIRENQAIIADAGGDGEAAWSHYNQGQIDETVSALEPDVLEVMDPRDEESDEDDDEDGEDEDDGDEA